MFIAFCSSQVSTRLGYRCFPSVARRPASRLLCLPPWIATTRAAIPLILAGRCPCSNSQSIWRRSAHARAADRREMECWLASGQLPLGPLRTPLRIAFRVLGYKRSRICQLLLAAGFRPRRQIKNVVMQRRCWRARALRIRIES